MSSDILLTNQMIDDLMQALVASGRLADVEVATRKDTAEPLYMTK